MENKLIANQRLQSQMSEDEKRIFEEALKGSKRTKFLRELNEERLRDGKRWIFAISRDDLCELTSAQRAVVLKVLRKKEPYIENDGVRNIKKGIPIVDKGNVPKPFPENVAIEHKFFEETFSKSYKKGNSYVNAVKAVARERGDSGILSMSEQEIDKLRKDERNAVKKFQELYYNKLARQKDLSSRESVGETSHSMQAIAKETVSVQSLAETQSTGAEERAEEAHGKQAISEPELCSGVPENMREGQIKRLRSGKRKRGEALEATFLYRAEDVPRKERTTSRLENKNEQAGKLDQKNLGNPSRIRSSPSELRVEKQESAPTDTLIPQPARYRPKFRKIARLDQSPGREPYTTLPHGSTLPVAGGSMPTKSQERGSVSVQSPSETAPLVLDTQSHEGAEDLQGAFDFPVSVGDIISREKAVATLCKNENGCKIRLRCTFDSPRRRVTINEEIPLGEDVYNCLRANEKIPWKKLFSVRGKEQVMTDNVKVKTMGGKAVLIPMEPRVRSTSPQHVLVR